MFFVAVLWMVCGIAAWLAALAMTRRLVKWSEAEDVECIPVFGPGIVIVAGVAVLEYSLAMRGGLTPPEWFPLVQALTSVLLLVVFCVRVGNTSTGSAG